MKYLILISADNTRDVQVYAGVPNDPDKTFSDSWVDYKNAEIFVGIYTASSEREALDAAAVKLDIPATSLRALCLNDCKGGVEA